MTGDPRFEISTPGASPEQAAAMVAAIEQFLRDTAPAPVVAPAPGPSAWKRAGLAEGVARQPELTFPR